MFEKLPGQTDFRKSTTSGKTSGFQWEHAGMKVENMALYYEGCALFSMTHVHQRELGEVDNRKRSEWGMEGLPNVCPWRVHCPGNSNKQSSLSVGESQGGCCGKNGEKLLKSYRNVHFYAVAGELEKKNAVANYKPSVCSPWNWNTPDDWGGKLLLHKNFSLTDALVI